MQTRHAAHPGQLALCQLARRGQPLVDELLTAGLPGQVLQSLPIADAAHRRQLRMHPGPVAQRTDLVEESCRQHMIEAYRDTRVQPGA